MQKQFIVRDDFIRNNAAAFILDLPPELTWRVLVEDYKDPRSLPQNAKIHTMIADITPRFRFLDRRDWHGEDVKRLLLDGYARVLSSEGRQLRQGSRIVPSLDGTGVVQLGVQSRQFAKDEAAEFIEYLYAYGADLDVPWKR